MRKKGFGLTWVLSVAFLVLTALISALSAPAPVYASQTQQISVVIPVTYTAKDTDVSLQCKLEYEENESQTVTADTLRLKDGEEGSFTITYTEPGTYQCQLYQVKGPAENVVYDERIVHATIYVTTDTAGKLCADVVLYEDGSDKLPSAAFVNQGETQQTSETETETETETGTKAKTETETETETTTGTNPVKTADTTPSAEPYAGLLLAAAAISAVLIFRKKEDVK